MSLDHLQKWLLSCVIRENDNKLYRTSVTYLGPNNI